MRSMNQWFQASTFLGSICLRDPLVGLGEAAEKDIREDVLFIVEGNETRGDGRFTIVPREGPEGFVID